MDLAKLQNRRAEVAARAKLLVSVGGSGWHKDDPQEKERLDKGGVSITKKVVGLLDDDRVYLVGDDAVRVLAGLKEYTDGIDSQKKLAFDTGGTLDMTPTERHAFNVARRTTASAEGVVALSTQDWNGMLLAMSVVGVHCTLASAVHTPVEERVVNE